MKASRIEDSLLVPEQEKPRERPQDQPRDDPSREELPRADDGHTSFHLGASGIQQSLINDTPNYSRRGGV